MHVFEFERRTIADTAMQAAYVVPACATRVAVRRTQIGNVVDGKVCFCLVTRGLPCRDLPYDRQLPTWTCVTGNGRVRSFRDNVSSKDVITGDGEWAATMTTSGVATFILAGSAESEAA